jgi:uncharacterized membrane protein
MSDQDLVRLEHQIGRLLSVGVILAAVAMCSGLVLHFLGIETVAVPTLEAGLVLLIAIPMGRILASFVDALRRDDRLLSISTGIVLAILLGTVVSSYVIH